MKKLIAFIIMLALMIPATAGYALETYGSWTLAAGKTKQSIDLKKSEKGAMEIRPAVQTSGPKIWYRGRRAVSADKATVAKSFTSKPSPFTVSYLSGYGYVNNPYSVAVQNDSTSTKSATVSGNFEP